MSYAIQSIRLRTNFKPVLKLKRKTMNGITNVQLSSPEDHAPSTIDSLSHAIRLYSGIRELWAEGTRAESGVCYVKVNGNFVQVTIARPKR
jgi:hypothetical protein